jgi:hypothetical protein
MLKSKHLRVKKSEKFKKVTVSEPRHDVLLFTMLRMRGEGSARCSSGQLINRHDLENAGKELLSNTVRHAGMRNGKVGQFFWN